MPFTSLKHESAAGWAVRKQADQRRLLSVEGALRAPATCQPLSDDGERQTREVGQTERGHDWIQRLSEGWALRTACGWDISD